ncbi:MAG: hypothetical protein SFV52_06555 [Saprospiraceae bacterium]|nr:hypothetical protein [Saprospiraceae bacterium]
MPSQRSIQALAASGFLREPKRCDAWRWATLVTGAGVSCQMVINTRTGSAGCSCTLRARPCYHLLALQAWLDAAGDDGFEPADAPPGPEAALLSVRRLPASEQQSRHAGAARRYRDRLERAGLGLDDLRVWMTDLSRRGLAAAGAESPDLFGLMARRMADASLPGLSRRFRRIAALPGQTPDWPETALDELAGMWLALQAFGRRDVLDEALLDDLEQFLGMHTPKEKVLADGPRLRDTWAVLGCREEKLEGSLGVRRTWLQGETGGQCALLLDYAFAGPFPPGFPTGARLSGELAFYPSAFLQRAVPVDGLRPLPEGLHALPAGMSVARARRAYAQALGRQPWLEYFPVMLHVATPVQRSDGRHAYDPEGQSLPLAAPAQKLERLHALGAGLPVDLFGEWDGRALVPLTASTAGKVVDLEAPE